MFDINAIVSAALNAAVQQAVAPLVERIAVLEQRVATLSSQDVAMGERIATLENNPAQGVDTTQARLITADAFVNHLDQQEWFWEKVSSFVTKAGGLSPDDVEAMIERALTDHCDTFNHDDYDRVVCAIDEVDLEDIITSDNLNDAINEALNGATVSISV